jgi:hypothetical protein
MARTAGSVSNIDIASHNLIRLLGGRVEDNTPAVMVTINAQWLRRFQSPDSDMVAITREDFERLQAGGTVPMSMESGQPVSQPIARPCNARFED